MVLRAVRHTAPLPDNADGVGLVEARAAAWVTGCPIRDGRIANYQMVAPTTWNFATRCRGRAWRAEQALVGAPLRDGETSPLAAQHIVRSFDPVWCAPSIESLTHPRLASCGSETQTNLSTTRKTASDDCSRRPGWSTFSLTGGLERFSSRWHRHCSSREPCTTFIDHLPADGPSPGFAVMKPSDRLCPDCCATLACSAVASAHQGEHLVAHLHPHLGVEHLLASVGLAAVVYWLARRPRQLELIAARR